MARVCGGTWHVYVAELVRLWADFVSKVGTGAFIRLVIKKFLACVCLNAPCTLCAFKNGLCHGRGQT